MQSSISHDSSHMNQSTFSHSKEPGNEQGASRSMPICLERLPALFKETKCPSKIFTLQTSAEDARCLDQQLAFLKLPVSPYSVQSNASSASAGGRSRQRRQLRGVLDDCLARNTGTEGSLRRLVCASKVSTGTAKVDVDYLVAFRTRCGCPPNISAAHPCMRYAM